MEDFKQRYIAARKAVIAQDLQRLNPMQRQAAMTTEGPLLLLAGAGSGKTTVLIQRVYNLLTYGRGSDSDEVPVWATEEDLQFLESFPARPTEEDVRRARHLCAVDVPRPWASGPPPSTPPASASCGGTLTGWGSTRTSPSTTPTTPSGSSRTC